LRRVDKHDLRKIANACGATIVTTLATSEGEEEFSSANLGECEEVYEEAVGDNNFVFFKGMKKCNCSSIIVRGANELMCDEIERSLHDSICVVKRTLESGFVVPGGGSCEVALSIKLEDFSRTLGNKE
jgi:T-complex protein 1 subunit alpha